MDYLGFADKLQTSGYSAADARWKSSKSRRSSLRPSSPHQPHGHVAWNRPACLVRRCGGRTG